ncbi:MAG: PEGA domain-containing protein [Candidatus Brocadiales bacterium]|nr:PEGA domain-containing protein [Candidatus Brocadiales bacterium]
MIKTIRSFRFLILVATVFAFSGCVTRSITVKTNPSNALVYIDDELIGESPVTMPFTFYGTRKIMIERKDEDGALTHERTVAFEKIKAPVYQVFPLDFFSELMWPLKIKDDQVLSYNLVELEPLSIKERQAKMLKSAEEMRQRVNAPEF